MSEYCSTTYDATPSGDPSACDTYSKRDYLDNGDMVRSTADLKKPVNRSTSPHDFFIETPFLLKWRGTLGYYGV